MQADTAEPWPWPWPRVVGMVNYANEVNEVNGGVWLICYWSYLRRSATELSVFLHYEHGTGCQQIWKCCTQWRLYMGVWCPFTENLAPILTVMCCLNFVQVSNILEDRKIKLVDQPFVPSTLTGIYFSPYLTIQVHVSTKYHYRKRVENISRVNSAVH